LTCGRHKQNPNTTNDSQELDTRSRGGNPEGEENQEANNSILEIRRPPMMLLEITNTIPGVKRGLETGDLLIARSRFRFGASTANSISVRNSVEERQINVLRPK